MHVAVTPGGRSGCRGRTGGRWLGGQQRSTEAESGSPRRSEVATLGLHVARLPGVAAGQLGEAGGHPGPAALVQWLSGRRGVAVGRGENGVSGAPSAGTGHGSRARGQLLPSWLVVQHGDTKSTLLRTPSLSKAQAQPWAKHSRGATSSGPCFKAVREGISQGLHPPPPLHPFVIDLPAKAHSGQRRENAADTLHVQS